MHFRVRVDCPGRGDCFVQMKLPSRSLHVRFSLPCGQMALPLTLLVRADGPGAQAAAAAVRHLLCTGASPPVRADATAAAASIRVPLPLVLALRWLPAAPVVEGAAKPSKKKLGAVFPKTKV